MSKKRVVRSAPIPSVPCGARDSRAPFSPPPRLQGLWRPPCEYAAPSIGDPTAEEALDGAYAETVAPARRGENATREDTASSFKTLLEEKPATPIARKNGMGGGEAAPEQEEEDQQFAFTFTLPHLVVITETKPEYAERCTNLYQEHLLQIHGRFSGALHNERI